MLKANAAGGYFSPRLTPTLPADVLDMENELREISAELAGSIRREMELEDLVERLQTEAQNPSVPGRRTSDYFSDSGTSSVRYGESDSRADDLERLQRKAEQEKAGIRLELTTKVQDERAMRKKLEVSIRELEERASQSNSTDSTGRLKELESTCEDLRRRLADERQAKDNFEDLLTALKLELQGAHAECDNLRDEVVPQLRARVEGLEAQTTQHERLAYDHTKVQQELKLLKEQSSPHPDMHKFNAIAENMPTRSSVAMSRSNSLAQASRSPLSRSTSIKTVESRETLVERVKEIEMQRDSLHRALKSLLERQDLQNKDYQKRIRQLEMERDKTVTGSPRRGGYNKEVERLRAEVNSLRRRADEAIEQKWQCEKGLSGLKMDLDRAEQEIESLKMLLHEKDILLAHGGDAGPAARPRSSEVSSEALEHAYKELQKAYVESLDRIQELQHSPQDTETAQALQQLRQSLQAAVSEQHLARREVESLQQQTIQLRQAEKSHVKEEQLLAESLRESAVRVESLAAEVRQQLSTNATLRNRLAETIERGELEQQSNAHKITSMQTHLKFLEDALLQAQQASEDAITRHEGELRKVRETQHSQLQRTKDTPRTFSPKSPLSPRLARTTSDSAMSVSESSKVAQLEKKVAQLEHALAEADTEMGDVIGRMNIAQVEVMDLQNHREEAVRETRRLQKELEMERLRVFEGGWASVSGGASGAAAARRAA